MKPQPNKAGKTVQAKKTAPAHGKAEPALVTSGSWFGFLFKPYNLLFLIVAAMFLSWCNHSVESYNWVYNSLLKDGYKYTKMVQKEIDNRSRGTNNPAEKQKIAYDTKMEAKLGVEYLVLKQIRDNTPENAVILFPPSGVMTQKTSYLSLRYEITMKPWAAHFLYPRTIVYEGEKGKNPFFDKIQYVFVLHGWGYQYLDYKPQQMNAVDVLPIHKPGNA